MGRAKRIAVVALCMMGWLAGGAVQAQDDATHILQSWQADVNLDDWREEKGGVFWDDMATLHDEEHASDSPHRLPVFNQMLERDARNAEIDHEVLGPWLYRYIWVIREPNYTEGAVRAFRRLDIDGDIIDAAMVEILAHHPHAKARAATLEYDEYVYQAWFEEPRFLSEAQIALTEDPSPLVRAAAYGLWELQPFLRAEFERLVPRITADPSPYVRSIALGRLAEIARRGRADQAALWDDAVRQELSRAENGWLLPDMLQAYLRNAGHHSDLGRATLGLNLLHQHREAPYYEALLKTMAWQMDVFAAEALVEFAPFADADALAGVLLALFDDPERPIDLRSLALEELAKKRPQVLDLPGLHAFVMNTAHTDESLGHLCPPYQGWCGDAMQMLVVPGAERLIDTASHYDLIDGLLTQFMTDPQGQLRTDRQPLITLIKEITRLDRRAANPDAHEAIKARLIDIVAESETYLLPGLSEWIEDRTALSDDEIITLAGRLQNHSALAALGDAMADRMRPGPFEDPVPQGRDLHVAAAIVAEMDRRVVDGADVLPRRFVWDMLWYGIPKKAALDPDLDGLAEFESALRRFHRHATEEDPIGIIPAWLGEG